MLRLIVILMCIRPALDAPECTVCTFPMVGIPPKIGVVHKFKKDI